MHALLTGNQNYTDRKDRSEGRFRTRQPSVKQIHSASGLSSPMKQLLRLCWSLTDADSQIRHRARIALFWLVFVSTVVGISAKVVMGGVYNSYLQ